MADFTDLLKTIKQASLEAVHADVPVAVVIGTVISESPLQIQVEQKLILTEAQLKLCRNVTDYTTDETVDHLTEYRAGGTGHAMYQSHNHQYKGRKEFLIHHKLLSGDRVLLLREQGGKHYYVIDRVV
jgi:hypothetical protein